MDTMSDAIDPSWWENALAAASVNDRYEPPELLSTHLERAAADPSVTGLHELALQVLAMASSAMLNPEDWLEPFTPAMQFHGKRTVVPADLDADQMTLLARIAPLVEREDLRARVADVAWVYGDRSDVAMLDRAIDAYRATPLTGDVWFSVGKDAWVRALALAARRGADGQARTQDMSDALKAQVLAGQVTDNFRTVEFAETLRKHGRVDASGRAEVSEALFALAARASSISPRLSRHLEREALAWLGGSNEAAANAATERVARTYIAEADARIEADPEAGALVEGHFLEKAIAVLRTIPRSHRLENGLDDLVDNLRFRLRESRESSMEQMMHIQSDPVDLTEAVSYARSHVSGYADKFDALAAFATLAPPLDEASTRKNAEKMLEGTISHIFGSSTFSSDFRKVASRPGCSGQADEDTVWDEMARTVFFHSQLLGKGIIQPAQNILTTEHRFSRQYMVSLCKESPAVPEGHETLWGNGLVLGMGGNYGAAVSVLVPQLEQVVRVMLKRHDVHTVFVDEHGVESEKSLNALLDMTETSNVFGEGIVMEMKAMLIVQGGPNLRNDIAHGLLDDNSAWSYSALYMWWFCLRLVTWPVIKMMDHARTQGAESDEGTMATGETDIKPATQTAAETDTDTDTDTESFAEDQPREI
ncbi:MULTISPECIES: DUF4209 domain-containing protein [unclassified Rhodococcus (in: high G+C Gram-positive bacteria)]|uniref:DUF4209 domain-containing protein n=1 Tax=unclassified Rhodococcus (in: high G+C Gram-positive bacteria) TaxID=192944 RepID=UPI000A56ECF1|nr:MULTISPECIES: DUF4209 domain-containing protein [unclassified Rhodococcus (in: high G+C Gram-positive bacteria)]